MTQKMHNNHKINHFNLYLLWLCEIRSVIICFSKVTHLGFT